jgi:hypothetical protein
MQAVARGRPATDVVPGSARGDRQPEASSEGVKMMPEPGAPESGGTVRRLSFLSVPVWDISDEEIGEWKQTPGLRFAAYTAECIRDGQYDDGQEVYPPGSVVYQEITREKVDRVMTILAERGMVRKSGGSWHAIAPGQMEPGIRRAVTVLLARRADLPPALAAELDAWQLTLDALAAPDGTRASPAAIERAGRPARPLRAIMAS